jgi:glycine cleavage system H protein
MLPKDLKYTSEHEWIKIDDERVIVGITEYAQKELGDVVFVDLPGVGEKFKIKDAMATIESVKAVSEIYAPISGEVMEVNDTLEHSPELVNQDPYGKGWIAIIEPSDVEELNELLTPDAYAALIGEKPENTRE